jgi:hypothetical protein
MTTVFDSKAWGDTYHLEHENLARLDSKFTPRLVMGEETLRVFCKQLACCNVLHGRQYNKLHHIAHKCMVFLDDASVEQDHRYQTLKQSHSHVPGKDPRGTTLIFTSIALLSNLCWCTKLDWKIAPAADGTHNMFQSTLQTSHYGSCPH